MEISFHLETDIQIPDHLYNEAAELFLNHLEKFCEEQLLIGSNSSLISQEQEQKRNSRKVFVRSLNYLNQRCPLYYKKGKGSRNALQRHRTQA